MGQVIYLTGAPATGKTKLCEALLAKVPEIRLFKYSERLAEQVSKRLKIGTLTVTDLRRLSSKRICPEDIIATDEELADFVSTNRSSHHVLIDSHAVTKEAYGYRATPFQLSLLSKLAPTGVLCLVAEAQVIQERIRTAAGGRPALSAFESDFHVFLQSSLALSYGLHLGVPIHFLDSSVPPEKLADELLAKMHITVI